MEEILPKELTGRQKLGVVIGIISLIILGAGVFLLKAGEFEAPVTIFTDASGSAGVKGNIWVDIEGAVEAPGVYKLGQGARIESVIQAAGGLTTEADSEWVEKNVNKAQVVTDGYKLYVPKKNKVGENSGVIGLQSEVISINSGSSGDLESLPGIGPVTAGKIIQSRPYTKLEELTERKIVGQKVFENIKDKIALW